MSSSSAQGKPWGRITWYFIHAFCERIDEQFFNTNIDACMTVLTNVCSMIPCPLCRNHATDFLKKFPIKKMVRTKEDLKMYFFRFHNQATLNGNPRATPADPSVLATYKRANFPAIVRAFKAEYMKKTPTRLDYAHTLYSQRILKSVISFLMANQAAFMPQAPSPENDLENITFSVHE